MGREWLRWDISTQKQARSFKSVKVENRESENPSFPLKLQIPGITQTYPADERVTSPWASRCAALLRSCMTAQGN